MNGDGEIVMIRRSALVAILHRSARLAALDRKLAGELKHERILLRSALHELALERDERPERFIARWLDQRESGHLRRRLGGGWR